MNLRRKIGELMGYSVGLNGYNYVLFDPKGRWITESNEFPNSTPDEVWDFLPAFDTWDGIGLLLEWLAEHSEFALQMTSTLVKFNDNIHVAGITDEFPRFICEQVLKECGRK